MARIALPKAQNEAAIIGLGTAALGRPAYITTNHGVDLEGHTSVEQMRDHALSVFDAAYDHGVRYFDAARSYGRAEEFLGEWIDRRNPGGIFVASKWGYAYVGEWRIDAPVHERKDHSVEAYRRQIHETKSLLGSHLNLYQIHSVTPESPALDDDELVHELLELKNSGVHIGMSTSGPRQAEVLERVEDLEVDGVRLFDAVQVTWNLLEQSTSEQLTRLHDSGIAVILKEALANGRLGPTGDRELDVEGSSEFGSDAIALATALAQPFSDVVLSGALTEAQLVSNLAAKLAAPQVSSLTDYAIARDQFWEERSNRPWT